MMLARFKPAHSRRRSPEAQAKLNRAAEKQSQTKNRTIPHEGGTLTVAVPKNMPHKKPDAQTQRTAKNPLLVRAKKLRASRRFSQNFLISESCLTRIAQEAYLPETPLPIVEIGPGCGFLTEALLALPHRPSVTALELDRHMIHFLEETLLPQYGPNRLAIVAGDVLKTEWGGHLPLIDTVEGSDSLAPFTLAGNLPYAISAPILLMLAGELAQGTQAHALRARMKRAVLMLQKEVAEKVVAKPNSKAWGTLALTMQQWFEVTWVCEVPPEAFYPAPKVTSAVVALTPRETPRCIPELEGYTQEEMLLWLDVVVHAGCQQKRKTLQNNWRAFFLEVLAHKASRYGFQCEWHQGTPPDMTRLLQPLMAEVTLLRAEACDWDTWALWTQTLVKLLAPWVSLKR
jgi:16S rRNA (adenine1518-N6/adenine1519-N6)-dimethyltransferase